MTGWVKLLTNKLKSKLAFGVTRGKLVCVMQNLSKFKSALSFRIASALAFDPHSLDCYGKAFAPRSTSAPEKRPITRSLLADARARVASAQVKPELMTSAQIACVLATLPHVAPIYVSVAQVRKERREGGLFTVGQLARR